MQGKKKLKKIRQLLCLLLAAVLICSIPAGLTFASGNETSQGTEELSETMEQDSDSQAGEVEEGAVEAETASNSDSKISEHTEAGTAESTETESVGNTEPEVHANSISGMLWLDMFDDTANSIYAGDGIRQAEEQPLADYMVSLYKADDTSNAVQTAITDTEGKYEFSNLEPGSYVVGVAYTTMEGAEYLLPFYYLDGTEGDNRFVAYYDEDEDAYLYAYTASITVDEDTIVTNMDAGMRTQPGASTYDAAYSYTGYFKILDEYGAPLEGAYWEVRALRYNSSTILSTTVIASGTTGSNGLVNISATYSDSNYSAYQTVYASFYVSLPEGTTHGSDKGTSIWNGDTDPFDRSKAISSKWYSVTTYGSQSSGSGLTLTLTFGSSSNRYVVQAKRQVNVTFDTQGGTMASNTQETYWSNETFETLATPTRAGYTFEGWYDAPTGGNLVIGTDTVGYTFPVTEGIGFGMPTEGTLYAGWTPDTHTVTEKYVDRDGNPIIDSGGTAAADTTQTVSYGSSYVGNGTTTVTQDYVYIGYKIGNATDTFDTAGNAVYGSTIPTISNVTADQTVYFIYTKASITIKKYEDNGTTILPEVTFKLEKMTDATYTTVDSTFTALELTTDSSGSLKFDNLKDGYYRITEVSAPSGFSTLKDPIEVELPYKSTATPMEPDSVTYKTTTDGTDTYYYYALTYTVTDQTELEMPTAGSGFLSQYHLWIGMVMIATAGISYAFRLRRRRLYGE